MKILFLTQVLPYPLDAGPKVRAYYVLRHLARDHEVTLASFVRATDTEAAIAHLRGICAGVHTAPMRRSTGRDARYLAESLVRGTPFLIARDWSPEMGALVRGLAASGQYDAVHADQLWMARYALEARKAAGGHTVRLVLDQHNAVYQIAQRMARGEGNPAKRGLLELEWRKLAGHEAAICRQFDRVVWVTEQDREAVRRAAGPAGREAGAGLDGPVIPICGDAEATAPVARRAGGRRVTFLGGLHYPPNAQGVSWFLREAWPLIARRAPDAVLTVIGKDPPADLREWDGAGSKVEVTGYVDDPRTYLAETAAFVVPLLAGGGMRVKIVDAWMWGLPVVSTTVGAEGIEIRSGENIMIADTPAEFARAVVRLLEDAAEGERLGRAGRAWAEARYDRRTAYTAWDSVYGNS